MAMYSVKGTNDKEWSLISDSRKSRLGIAAAYALLALSCIILLSRRSHWDTHKIMPLQMDRNEITWTVDPFNPPAIPLAVRSVYVSTWLEAGNNAHKGILNSQFASAFNGNYLPWAVGIIVDGEAYTVMSTPGQACMDGPPAKQLSMTFTASKTVFVMEAGSVVITLEFLSPLTPGDLVRQTLPYSYLSIIVTSKDGKDHDTKLYTDIDARFISNNWKAQCYWNTTCSGGLIYHQASLESQDTYGEFDDFTSSGPVVYATSLEGETTYGTGEGSKLRRQFQQDHKLSNDLDTAYRAIEDRFPAFAFSRDLGKVGTSTTLPFLLVIGRYRTPAISWTAVPESNPDRDLYFMTASSQLHDSIAFFYNDYHYSKTASHAFDAELDKKASSVSSKYKALVYLAARQVYAGMETSVGKYEDGTYNAEDIMAFTKEIATSNYVSTVDIIYPAFPFFIYTSQATLKAMLEPILRYTASGRYPNTWALHDLGPTYPKATGHDDGKDEAMFVEESAGMLIMEAAYVMATGDTSQLEQYYSTFKGWADFLLDEALFPRAQVSSDDFQGALTNSTNLAVKGIVGIGAMSKLAAFLKKPEDENLYRTKAEHFVGEFLEMAISTKPSLHVKITYQAAEESWVLLYHLFGDRLLELNLFPKWLYNVQESFYLTKREKRGIRLDSRNDMAKSDWQLMAAAAHFDNVPVRDILIDGVYDYLDQGTSMKPFPDAYHMESDEVLGFVDRMGVGSAFSLLSLERLKESR